MQLQFITELLLQLVTFLGAVGSSSANAQSTHSPILIITGFGGSQLNVQDMSNTGCSTNGEAIRIWTNRTHIETSPECFLSQIRLNYADGRYLDAQDVTISTADFGSVSSFVNFSDIFPTMDDSDIVKYFLQRGYTENVDIRAAPYDWRLGSEQLNERGYYANLQWLIEQMHQQNGNTRVTLIVLSMGAPVSHYFLTRVVNQEWKDSYIHSYISLAGAWAGLNGVVSALLTPLPTSNFLFYPIQSSVEELRSIFRTFPSYYFLLSRASVLNDQLLVVTPTRNYTAHDYEQLFTDVGYPQGYVQFREYEVLNFSPPNVTTYCFYSLGIPTPETFVYDVGFPNSQPTIINGEGDLAVNRASLEVCLRWADSAYPFNSTVFQGVDHVGFLTNPRVLQAVGRIVGAPEDPINAVLPLTTLHQLCTVTVLSIIFTLIHI